VALAPSGEAVAMSAVTASAGGDDSETLRIARLDGALVWQAHVRAPTLVAPAWSPRRDELVVPTPGRWSVVSLASGVATTRTIAVPTYEREPVSRIGSPVVTPVIAAFSVDAQTVYAAVVDSPIALGLRPLFAVDLARAKSAEVGRLGRSLADETALGGSPALARVDPVTGRVVGPAGPSGGVVRIYAPDGVTETVRISRPRILGATWAPSGLLAVLSTAADTTTADPTATDATRLELVAGDGSVVRTPWTTTAVERGTLLAAPNGYVLIAFGAGDAFELAAVRLQDGAVASITLSAAQLSDARLLGWLPSDGR
jgi:hypothetical protein